MTVETGDAELVRVIREARKAIDGFVLQSPTTATVMAAIIHYQAAQMIVERLDAIQQSLADLNQNFWRSKQQ